jgi:hypothetical protein
MAATLKCSSNARGQIQPCGSNLRIFRFWMALRSNLSPDKGRIQFIPAIFRDARYLNHIITMATKLPLRPPKLGSKQIFLYVCLCQLRLPAALILSRTATNLQSQS